MSNGAQAAITAIMRNLFDWMTLIFVLLFSFFFLHFAPSKAAPHLDVYYFDSDT
jgi:hypothetical protein